MHARYYSPNLGRFLSVDPIGGSIGSSQSWNRYSYVENNPVGFVDQSGRARVKAIHVGPGYRYKIDFDDYRTALADSVPRMIGKRVFKHFLGPGGEYVYTVMEKGAASANDAFSGGRWAGISPTTSGLAQFKGIGGAKEATSLEKQFRKAFSGMISPSSSYDESLQPLERLKMAVDQTIDGLDSTKYSDEDKARLKDHYNIDLLGELSREDANETPGADRRSNNPWDEFERIQEPGTTDR